MEKDVQLGPETKASIVVNGSNVVLGINYQGAQAGAQISVSLDIEQFGALLKNAIPGTIDDVIIDTLISALKVIAPAS